MMRVAIDRPALAVATDVRRVVGAVGHASRLIALLARAAGMRAGAAVGRVARGVDAAGATERLARGAHAGAVAAALTAPHAVGEAPAAGDLVLGVVDAQRGAERAPPSAVALVVHTPDARRAKAAHRHHRHAGRRQALLRARAAVAAAAAVARVRLHRDAVGTALHLRRIALGHHHASHAGARRGVAGHRARAARLEVAGKPGVARGRAAPESEHGDDQRALHFNFTRKLCGTSRLSSIGNSDVSGMNARVYSAVRLSAGGAGKEPHGPSMSVLLV